MIVPQADAADAAIMTDLKMRLRMAMPLANTAAHFQIYLKTNKPLLKEIFGKSVVISTLFSRLKGLFT